MIGNLEKALYIFILMAKLIRNCNSVVNVDSVLT